MEEGREDWSDGFRFRRKDGSYAYVLDRGHILRDSEGRAIRMVGGMTDLTERHRTEEKLREQAALLDNAKDAIIVRDLDHRILYWNRSAELLYGWPAGEVEGRPVDELLYRDTETFARATRATLENGEWVGEIDQWCRDGRPITVEGRWTLMRDRDGRPKSIFAINTDVTQRKRLEAQFLRAQRMESIGTLAGGIAHDLNNVLTPIIMSIDLLKLDETDPDKLEALAAIESSARRGSDMVKQVLSFARGMDGQRVLVQLRHVVRDLARILGDTFPKNIMIEHRIPADLWTLDADPTQLHQILLNLCVNARDAMPNGGRLAISAENIALDEHYAAMNIEARTGPHVRIEVQDSGMGIPKDVVDKIFDPFFTTKEVGKGTGLGLSTTQAIVKSHGGFIRVYSEPGMGTRFRIYLPAQPEAYSGEDGDSRETELPRGDGETILVVDDEPSVRQITQQTLEAFGYRVLLAADGSEAVSVYVRHQADIAAVITDMRMPIMDGPATIQVLRRLNPEVRIIGASGITEGDRASQAAQAGVKDFLPKPYTAETLLKSLKRVLSKPRQ